MPRINALNILLESDGKEYLAELYGKTIEGVQKALISGSMKNMDLSGDPVSSKPSASSTPPPRTMAPRVPQARATP